ncbi:unnamed protein product, partial [Symbiodinium sp. CCMP2456]
MATTPTTASSSEAPGSFQLPWQAIPKFIPGTTDVTEYSRKLQFLAAMWPKEHLSLLAPRAALMCEGTSFKKVASLDASKLKANDESGVKLLVSTLGGSWGKTALEEKYDCFEKAIYGTIQKADETNDSYVARHDVHFEELLAGGVTLKEVRAYILLRQSQLTADDRKRIVVEMNGALDYQKVCSAIRLLGSRFFTDLQGQRSGKTKTYDANYVDEGANEEPERALQVSAPIASEDGDGDLDNEFMEALIAAEDHDAMQVQAFEEELEGFFQETPDLQEALVSYLEARGRLLAKKRSRGFWPVASSGKGSKGGRGFKGGKGKGKNAREQLLARISRSHCRACGEKGHWKAECPKVGKSGAKGETATTTVAEVDESTYTMIETAENSIAEISTSLPEGTLSLDEAHLAVSEHRQDQIKHRLRQVVENMRPIEAILDTGASRCVMGKSLVSGFLSQLETAQDQILWLGIEVVPGGTCLLRKHTSRQKANLCITRKSQQLLSPSAPILHSRLALHLRCLPMFVSKGSLTLGARYAQLNDPQLHLSLDEMEAMSLEQLGELKIDFGRTMSGRTYMDVAINEQAWSKWIIEHMAKSTKKEHQAFLRFMERYVEEAEGVEASLLDALEASEPGRAAARPKIAAKKGTASRAAASSDTGPETWDLVNDRERDSALDHQVTVLSTRVNQMESVMQQVLVAIQELNVDTAKKLVQESAVVGDLKKSELHEQEKMKPSVYLVFGMFVHGGQDSLLTYGHAVEAQLDVLEVYANADRKHVHQTIAGRLRELSGTSVSQFAGSYCDGFAEHVARQLVQTPGTALAADGSSPLTRKRFKTSTGSSVPNITLGPQKREGSNSPEGDMRGSPQRRFELSTANPVHDTVELPGEEWVPLFETASTCGGNEDRTTMRPERKKLRVEALETAITVLGYSAHVIHVLDEASCFHLGQPHKFYLDPAGEFRSEEMLEKFQSMNSKVFISTAAWQRGRVERHGDIAKDMLARIDTQQPIVSDTSFDQALLVAFQAKNALVRHRGYSPEQIVLGKSVRIPGSLTSDEDLASHAITEGSDLEAEQHRVGELSEVERNPSLTAGSAAPSQVPAPTSVDPSGVLPSEPEPLNGMDIPIPESDEGLMTECINLASTPVGEIAGEADELFSFLTLQASKESTCPPVAEDNLPFVVDPLVCNSEQAYCLEIPVSAKTLKQWAREKSPEQMSALAAVSKRKAVESNPLAMEPPPEVRKALNLKDDQVCELLGNAYGRVDAPLLFYKELSKQLLQLGFTRHPLEPCVFMLYTGQKLNGILGVHVDDGVCGGDAKFSQKIQELEKKLPFGSRKYRSFVFTGIHLEQFPDFSIRAAQSDYVRNIPQIDIGRTRRQ